MDFKSEHPDYKGYESNEFYVTDLPDELGSALQGYIASHCDDESELKIVINYIAGLIPTELTTNWGWSFLIEDLPYYVDKLCKLPMPKVMDFLANVCIKLHLSFSIEGTNEFLENLKIGYTLELDRKTRLTSWLLREDVSARTAAVEDTLPQVKDICTQTLDHLNQAKKHLMNTNSERDRKDAIRDCLSAMESMLTFLSGKVDIKDATIALRATKSWGPDIIIKDGLSLWDRMHDLYPDIRHGNPNKSNITDVEALFWLERITCFIRYISRVYKQKMTLGSGLAL